MKYRTSTIPVVRYREWSLSTKILVWMIAGVITGLVLGDKATVLRPAGDLLMRLLLMAAIPLIFFNLIAGVSGIKDKGALGRLGIRSLFYYLTTTLVALLIGVVVASRLQPGSGMQLSDPVNASIGESPGLAQVLLDMVPSNMLAAFGEGNVVQVVVIAIFLGISVLFLPETQREQLKNGFALLSNLLKQLVGLILKFSPFGIAALVAASVGEFGGAIFGPLAKFLATVWLAQLLMVCAYLAFLRLATGRNVSTWLRQTGPLYATTAATCSSLASLVVAMEVARQRLRLPENVYSFTLPLGTQLNKDGTSITLAVILLFTAQAIGFTFSTADVVALLLIGLVLSQGSGGVPQGGLVLAFIYLQSFGMPLEFAGILAGVYRLVDMGNTTVNCMGDMAWTTIVSDRSEEPSTETV
ncbi:MAG: dicarboxylate/amino acid:cation symporter [Pseudomonadota bacterium]